MTFLIPNNILRGIFLKFLSFINAKKNFNRLEIIFFSELCKHFLSALTILSFIFLSNHAFLYVALIY